MQHRFEQFLQACLLTLWAAPAAAWDTKLPFKAGLAGPALAVGFHGESKRPLIGAEVSVVANQIFGWVGAYADAVYDGDFRMSFGPEFGLLIFGLDGGLLLDFRDGTVARGYVLRPHIAVPTAHGVFVPYWRTGKNLDTDQSFAELGLLFKMYAWGERFR